MGRPAHDNSGRNPESADHREEMEPGARDVPGSCGDSANGHPAPSFEGSASGSDAAGAIRARRAECERGRGVGSAVQSRPRANFTGSRICFPGTFPLLPKGVHLSRGTPLSLGWRAVSLPQAPAAKSRLTGLLPLLTTPCSRGGLDSRLACATSTSGCSSDATAPRPRLEGGRDPSRPQGRCERRNGRTELPTSDRGDQAAPIRLVDRSVSLAFFAVRAFVI
jgi:hypothetical protein